MRHSYSRGAPGPRQIINGHAREFTGRLGQAASDATAASSKARSGSRDAVRLTAPEPFGGGSFGYDFAFIIGCLFIDFGCFGYDFAFIIGGVFIDFVSLGLRPNGMHNGNRWTVGYVCTAGAMPAASFFQQARPREALSRTRSFGTRLHLHRPRQPEVQAGRVRLGEPLHHRRRGLP